MAEVLRIKTTAVKEFVDLTDRLEAKWRVKTKGSGSFPLLA
jgi:hypothetical protein